MKKAKYLVSGLLSAVLIPLSLHSVQAADISDCQAILDRLARYACYDSWDAASGTISRQSGTPAPAPRVQTRVEEPEEEGPSLLGRIFNRDDEEAQTAEPAQAEAAPAETTIASFGRADAQILERSDGKTELTDTIVALERFGPTMWRITLASGQVWQQMYSKGYLLSVGDEVRIYPTRWGSSYRLSAARLSGYIQVERVD